jgi:hypothetical protein
MQANDAPGSAGENSDSVRDRPGDARRAYEAPRIVSGKAFERVFATGGPLIDGYC